MVIFTAPHLTGSMILLLLINVRFWHEADRLTHCEVCYERTAEVHLNMPYEDEG